MENMIMWRGWGSTRGVLWGGLRRWEKKDNQRGWHIWGTKGLCEVDSRATQSEMVLKVRGEGWHVGASLEDLVHLKDGPDIRWIWEEQRELTRSKT